MRRWRPLSRGLVSRPRCYDATVLLSVRWFARRWSTAADAPPHAGIRGTDDRASHRPVARSDGQKVIGHFGPDTFRHWDTSAIFRWVRTVRTFRHHTEVSKRHLGPIGSIVSIFYVFYFLVSGVFYVCTCYVLPSGVIIIIKHLLGPTHFTMPGPQSK